MGVEGEVDIGCQSMETNSISFPVSKHYALRYILQEKEKKKGAISSVSHRPRLWLSLILSIYQGQN